MIKYLAFSEDADARALLLKMLDDEEKKIRMKALGALEGKNYPEIRQKLDALAFDKELTKKRHDEQEAIFMILGSVGDAQTVKRLEEMVFKKNKFFGKNRDGSVLAIRALEKIKAPEAVRLLEKLAADSSPLVQTQAKRALGMLAKSMALSGQQ
ncbi:MAG: HEAT repeat domain-containing protein [Chitinivibrionia bacterium]|nr:HEAT repeat domain-containing protein [Chitinivibrionia bacterium]